MFSLFFSFFYYKLNLHNAFKAISGLFRQGKMGIIILNFKAYSEAVGAKAEELAKICKDTKEATGVRIIVAPQTVDIMRTTPLIETFSQYASVIKPGSGTGSNLVEALKEAGASGSLLNHSERRIPYMQIKETVDRLREAGMVSVVCAQDEDEARALAEFNSDYIAVEPPELIGSGISVSEAKPEVITNTVQNIKQVNSDVGVLCGAGISNGSDVKKAIELGAEGVLLASAFTKAADPRTVLINLCGGL